MSKYESNPFVEPLGYQPVEFLDIAPMSESEFAPGVDREHGESRFTDRERAGLTQSARDLITLLVQSHEGDSADVRSIIHDLGSDAVAGSFRPVELHR